MERFLGSQKLFDKNNKYKPPDSIYKRKKKTF